MSVDNLKHEANVVSKSYFWAICALAPLLLVYWSLQPNLLSEELLDVFNATLPLYFIAVLCLLLLRVLKGMQAAIWTILAWYPLQSAVFYGFGPLVQIYGNELTKSQISSHYLGISAQELFRAHQLSVTGIAMVLLGILAHLILARKQWTIQPNQSGPVIDTVRLSMTFIVVGGVFKYFVLKPSEWGMIDTLIPGVLSNLGNMTDLGFAIVAYNAARGSRTMFMLIATLLPIHIFLCTLSMSKTEVFIALLLPAIGYYVGGHQLGRLLKHLVVLALIFMLQQSWVHYGRNTISARTGTISQADYVERITILNDYIFSVSEKSYEEDTEQRQGWWTRLNFSGPQARAMELYDRGFDNPTLSQAWVYFIPRAIWPGKPILNGPGLNFYRLLTGNETARSFLGLSIYGDLYWQFGWRGLFAGCFAFGWLLGITGSRALRTVRNQEFTMLPFVFMALELGLLSPNKYILNGAIGPLPIMIFYYVFMSGVLWVVKSGKHPSGLKTGPVSSP